MNLQRIINPFSVSEMPDKQKNRLLLSAHTEKRVYYTLQIHKLFSRLLRCEKTVLPFIILRKCFTVL